MSFIGRSAEEVYRYALRRDRNERSLSDGFGFSIVLVNDGSPVGVQFLLDYFTQLSHRTSDRVRFIFFGEMTEAETTERTTRGARLGDQWIRREWRELQPDALELVRKPAACPRGSRREAAVELSPTSWRRSVRTRAGNLRGRGSMISTCFCRTPRRNAPKSSALRKP